MDFLPEGYWKINADTNGRMIVISGSPPSSEELGVPEDDPINHSCDEMGCASVGPHVLLIVPTDDPRILWTKPDKNQPQ